MAIENNLPVILDTATHDEDGLMSYLDKIKLDGIDQNLNNKLDRGEVIDAAQIPKGSITQDHLTPDVIKAITGTADLPTAVIGSKSVTTDKIDDNAVSIEKLDKRLLLSNVVAPRPISFVFDTKKVSITIPRGTLLMLDAISERDLADYTNGDITLSFNYADKFEGLNYLVSTKPQGTAKFGELKLYNNRYSTPIPNTSSIVALIYITTATDTDNVFKSASVVMHGAYTVNGLAQGVGTDNSALMGTGKIVFDSESGIIDFSQAPALNLITGGVLDRLIQNQASIRIGNYSVDGTYVLYWNNDANILETAFADIQISNANKIALISDGIIIPFINTGIYYSMPKAKSAYYVEDFGSIHTITVSSDKLINIVTKDEKKIEFSKDTVISTNQVAMTVSNTECEYEDMVGLHYILFDLDTNEISCRYHDADIDADIRYIVIGTLWVRSESVLVSGNFKYTVDGKEPYEDDLHQAETDIKQLQDIIITDLQDNKILSADDIYMISGEELPIYESSMLVKTVEGIKSGIVFNKNNDIMSPRTTFFDNGTLLNDENGDSISLIAYDKYNNQAYLKKDVDIKKVPADHKKNQNIRIMCLGDNLINDQTAYYLNYKLTSLGMKPTMVGTMVNSQVYGEGRDGWFYSTFVGASGRGKEEGKINPQAASGNSSILLNPFVRTANADDKAKNPNDCYRATGAYVEKSYYTDNDKNGAFYIFDFAKYLEVQGVTKPDVVVIALKPELSNIFTEDIVSTNMKYMQQLVKGIRAALPNSYIAIVPQYGLSAAYDNIWKITSEMIDETAKFIAKMEDNRLKMIPAWLHMNRELGSEYTINTDNSELYEERASHTNTELSETAKIELANAIAAFIMNIE